MKRIFSLIVLVSFVSLAILSCKDDFNEEDFLRLQSDLKLKQDSVMRARDKSALDSTSEEAVEEFIAASNEAGDLLALTLIVRENGVPVEGVSVNITTSTANAISNGKTQAIQTGTTDASGNVVFDRVVIGAGTISFAKTGYISSTALVDFGAPAAPTQLQINDPNGNGTITKYLPPTKRYEEGLITMFSTNPAAGSTATIRGRVTIENDVTNVTPEVPAGVVIRANMANLASTIVAPFIVNYTLADNSSLGVATVAANGDYVMTVPATAAGVNIPLIIPNIEGTCRMAVNGYDNGTEVAVTLAAPEYRDVPTSWGPQAMGVGGTSIPGVVGARIVVPNAPAAGSGFALDFVRLGKSITTGTINSSSSAQALGANYYKITSRGLYSAAAPTVTVNGDGSGATATALLRTMVTSISLTNAGTGYTTPSSVRINATLQDGSTQTLSTATLVFAGSTIPTSISNLTNVDGDNGGFGADDATLFVPETATALSVVIEDETGTGATVTTTMLTELASVTITNGGSGYTTAPTFTFTGGGLLNGSASHASVEVLEFPVQWEVFPNNAATSDYPVLPDFTINAPPSAVTAAGSTTVLDLFGTNSALEQNDIDIQSAFMLQNGDIVKRYPALRYIVSYSTDMTPQLIIDDETQANTRLAFSAADINGANGQIINNPTAVAFGNGYNTPMTATVVPAIAGAPGSGALIQVGTTFSSATGEYSYSSSQTTNPGSGYLPNLNQRATQTATLPTQVNAVQAGKSYTVDITYGTGMRRVFVN